MVANWKRRPGSSVDEKQDSISRLFYCMDGNDSLIQGLSQLLEWVEGVAPFDAALAQGDDCRSPICEGHEARAKHEEGHQFP